MKEDPAIERVREVRRKISEKYDHDVVKLIRHYQELEEKTARKFFRREIEQDKSALA